MKAKFSLKLQLTTIILTLLLTSGAILGWFHHQQTSEIFLTSAKQLFEEIAEDVSENFQAEYGPVSTTVRLLALSPIIQDTDRSSRLTRLPVLVSVLEAQPEIVALSVGYSGAEYFIVRSLNSSYMLKRFGAPEGARYMVDNIERKDGQPEFTRLFYDQNLTFLIEQDMGFTSYNPTVRPWYRLAVYNNNVSVTTPYLFYFIGKVGVTVVKEEPHSANVFAADITLESLSNTLLRNKVSPSSQMLLYTSENEVIASLDPESIVVTAGDDKLSISQLSQLKNPVVMDFFQQTRQTSNSHFFLDSGGARWIGINKPLSLAGFTANLLILAPEAELLAEAYTIRRQATVITVIIILFSLPLALLAAQQLARPLQKLVSQTRPAELFDFSKPFVSGSSIRDIQQLESALETARKTAFGLTQSINLLKVSPSQSELMRALAGELLTMTNAEGVLLYRRHFRDNTLNPECFRARSGIKIHHNCPALNLADDSPLLVSAFQSDSVQIIDLNHDIVEKLGTHNSLLNYLGADHLKLAVVATSNNVGKKSGLLCLIFRTDQQSSVSILADSEARQSFFHTLATFCDIAMNAHPQHQPAAKATIKPE